MTRGYRWGPYATPLQETFARQVRADLAAAGLTQKQFAAYVNYSVPYLSQALGGEQEGTLTFWNRVLETSRELARKGRQVSELHYAAVPTDPDEDCRCGRAKILALPHLCHGDEYTCTRQGERRTVSLGFYPVEGREPLSQTTYVTFACDPCWADYQSMLDAIAKRHPVVYVPTEVVGEESGSVG